MSHSRMRCIGLLVALLATACGRGETVTAYPDELAGVGVILQADGSSGDLVVSRLISGGPAATVGLQVGDRVRAIDGQPTRGHTLAEAVKRLRGREGTDVAISVDSGPSGRTIYSVRRQVMARGTEGKEYQVK